MNTMYSVGIDAAKGKSTVCITNHQGESINAPYEVKHTRQDLEELSRKIKELEKNGKVKVVMEATGIYHWPIFKFLKENHHYVSIINPLRMKLFSKNLDFRLVKTDKIDSTILASYGTEKWNSLTNCELKEDNRAQLRTLARAYTAYQRPKINMKMILDLELEKSMPGIKDIMSTDKKLYDFVLEFWHFDNIRKLTKKKFEDKFYKWAKKKDHKFHQNTPIKIYELAKEAIPTVPSNSITKLTVTTAVNSIIAIDKGLEDILAQATEIAKGFPEYEIVKAMGGVGDVLTTLLIAEIGDIRIYHNKKSLVCTTGIDVPPYESGQYISTKRKITKKGNRYLRRHLYLVMRSILMSKPKDDRAVYDFMIKKRLENKKDKQVKVAGMRKFLHIYYARVKELYKELEIWNIAD